MTVCLYYMNEMCQTLVTKIRVSSYSGLVSKIRKMVWLTWFVIKHSMDQALSRDLLSKYGFVAADATKVGINTKNKGKGKGAV